MFLLYLHHWSRSQTFSITLLVCLHVICLSALFAFKLSSTALRNFTVTYQIHHQVIQSIAGCSNCFLFNFFLFLFSLLWFLVFLYFNKYYLYLFCAVFQVISYQFKGIFISRSQYTGFSKLSSSNFQGVLVFYLECSQDR